MKKLLLFYALFFITRSIEAQDTIIKYNDELILSKVLELTPTEIKYKKYSFLDGPTYIEEKSTIRIIKYSNGTKEEFQVKEEKKVVKSNTNYYEGIVNNPNKIEAFGSHYYHRGYTINERELHNVLLQSKNKQIITLVGNSKDAHKLQFIGFAAIPLGVASFYFFQKHLFGTFPYGTGRSSKQRSGDLAASGICLLGAIACPIFSGISKHNRTSYNRQAVKIYNETY